MRRFTDEEKEALYGAFYIDNDGNAYPNSPDPMLMTNGDYEALANTVAGSFTIAKVAFSNFAAAVKESLNLENKK
ncbi:hypothetical protein MPC38_06700 [Prescottella equi]|uniref:hypothetical protein n=1 Tax=Rhodococcus hoagii TaxID=43767 RepID=UPI001F5B9196|nr:hypothetical protein [Prescottella equi]UNQ40934.1 hypothetical protein MPC38_06700 [Prescottella equi]